MKTIYFLLLFISAVFVNGHLYAKEQVVEFYWFTDDKTFVADDMEYKTTTYTVVQNYGNEDERLFAGSLTEGDLLLLTYELVGSEKQRVVSKIEILKNEAEAEKVEELLFND